MEKQTENINPKQFVAEEHTLQKKVERLDPTQFVTKEYVPLVIYKTAVIVLGVISIVGMFGLILLSLYEKNSHDAILAITSATVGGLVGIVAKTNNK